MPLQIGKIPIVVPRQKQFDEHVNNHQVDFCRRVASSQKNIIVVEDIETLEDVLGRYDELTASMPTGLKSNNLKFCNEFEKIVQDLFRS